MYRFAGVVECERELAVIRAAGGRELLDCEVLVVTLEHPPTSPRQRFVTGRRLVCSLGCVVGALADRLVVVDQQPCGCAGARERGVAPARPAIALRGAQRELVARSTLTDATRA
jgi:hypothetical protein